MGNFFSSLSKDIPVIEKETREFFDLLKTDADFKAFNNPQIAAYAKNVGLADEELHKFLNDSRYGQKDLDSFTQYLKDQNNVIDLQTFKTKALVVAKKMLLNAGVAIVSMLVTKAITAWSDYNKKLEEARQNAVEAAKAFEEDSDAIDDYTSRYKELQQALVKAKGNEEETYNLKKQLLELQTELNEKYGEEYGKINLVSRAYDDQTESIRKYSKIKASEFLDDNKKEIERAKKAMEEETEFLLGYSYDFDDKEIKKELESLVTKYSDQGLSFGEDYYGTGERELLLTANADSANDTIKSLMNDLIDLENKYADSFGETEVNPFSLLLADIRTTKNEVDGIISDWGKIYTDSQLAEIAKDDSLALKMNEAEEAVKAYNDAVLKSEDPINDSEVKSARENLKSLEEEMSTGKWTKYSSIVEDVFSQAETAYFDFINKMSDTSYLQLAAESIRGLDEITLRGMALDGTKDDFDALIAYAEKYGLGIDDLITALKELGYIQGQVFSATENQTSVSFTDLQSKVQGLSSGLDQLSEIYSDIKDGGTFDFSSILNNDDFSEAFGGLGDSYDKFIETVSNSPNDISACQDAFNDLVTAYIENSEALKGVTEESKNATIARLEEMGVVNAEEIVMAELGLAIENYEEVKKQAAAKSIDLTNATWEEIDALVSEGIVAEESATSLFNYHLKKALSNNNPISTVEDCNQLYNLAVRCGATSEVLQDLIRLRQIYETLADSSYGLSQYDMNDLLSQANALQQSIKKQVEGYESSYAPVSNYVSKLDDAGSSSGKTKDATDELTESLKAQQKELEAEKDALVEAQEELDNLYDAIQWFLDGKIDDIDDIIDKIQEANDALEEQKDNLDAILSIVDQVYNDEIDLIQAKIDALDKENDAKEKALALEEARMELERLRNNKTILQYTADKGYIYTTDESAIKEAENDVAEKSAELEKAKIKEELENQIALLEKYRDMWGEIADAHETALKEMATASLFGPDWKNAILNSDESTIQGFEDNYTGIQKEVDKNEEQITFYESEKQKYDDLKELWEDAKNAYIKSEYEAKLASFFGSDYEFQLLNNSSTWRLKFAEEYSNIQMQLEDVEDRIKSITEEIARVTENSANKITDAVNKTTEAVKSLKSSSAVDETGTETVSTLSDSISTTITKLEGLKTAISELNFAQTELDTKVNTEVVNTGESIEAIHEKVKEIISAISLLIISFSSLHLSVHSLLTTLQSMNEEVSFEGIIAKIGTGSDGNDGTLLGSISAVINKLSGDSEGGLINRLEKLNTTSLETLIASFNGDPSLLSAIKQVSNEISEGDNSLVARINLLSSTVTIVDGVKGSFKNLETQISACKLQVSTLDAAIQGIKDKVVTITVQENIQTSVTGVSAVGGIDNSILESMPYGKYSEGGIIGKGKEYILDPIAESVGEDHMVAVKEGEALLSQKTVKSNAGIVRDLLSADGNKISADNSIILPDGQKLLPYVESIPGLDEINTNLLDDMVNSINRIDMYRKAVSNHHNLVENTSNSKTENVTVNVSKVELPNITNGDEALKLIHELKDLDRQVLHFKK